MNGQLLFAAFGVGIMVASVFWYKYGEVRRTHRED